MEWIDGVPLSSIHASGLMNQRVFAAALDTLSRFHDQRQPCPPPPDMCMLNYLPKLRRRFDEHASGFFRDLLGVCPEELDYVYDVLSVFFQTYAPQPRGVIHGDFWMGNLVWNPAHRRVRALDMRGALGNTPCMGGDCAYDFAKLYQSLIGFDHLLLSSPSTAENEEDERLIDMLEEHVFDATHGAVDIYQVHMIACALVFGCVMFHEDSVGENPRAWKRFLLDDMMGERRHAMLHRANSLQEKKKPTMNISSRGKKAAFVLRGIARHSSYVHHTGKRVEIDFRIPAESIVHNVVRDLESEFGYDVDTFLVTYANLNAQEEAEMVGAYRPKNGHVHYMRCRPEESNQRDLFKHALRVVMEEADPVTSLVVVLRFDLEMKTPLSKLSINQNAINFLWRERPLNAPSSVHREIGFDGRVMANNPGLSRRPAFGPTVSANRPRQQTERKNERSGVCCATPPVCDVLQIFPAHFTNLVYDAASRLATPSKLHGLLGPIYQVSEDAPVNFLLDDDRYHESNTDVCPNPVYHIVRAASAQMVPGHTSHFWKKLLGSNWRRI